MKGITSFACSIFLLGTFFFSCQSNRNNNTLAFKGDLFDDTHLHELRLTFSEPTFWDSLVAFKKMKDSMEVNHYYKCNLNVDGTELNDIGIRLKGESSYDFTKGKKKSFKLDLNCFIRKQKHCGVSRINLNNNYKDPSLMREKLMLDLMKKEGIPAPRSAYAKVYLNDEYWGVYLMVEGINKDFLRNNFNSASGNLYFGEPNGTLEKLNANSDYTRNYRKKNNKKQNDWTDLIHFITFINSTDKELKQAAELDSIFNVDNCLKTWALNNLLVNVDAYNMMYPHNYYLFHDSTSNKLQWINYDYNYSFAAWNPKFTYAEICNFPILYCAPNFPFASLILAKNTVLKKRYLSILQNLVENRLNEQEFAKSVAQYYALIKVAVEEDTLKEYSNEEFEKNKQSTLGDKNDPGAFIPGLIEFVHLRKESVLKQLTENPMLN